VTNITFIFETSPNTQPKEKKVGGHGIFCPTRLKKWGDTSPASPNKLRPWTYSALTLLGAKHFNSAPTVASFTYQFIVFYYEDPETNLETGA